MSQHGASAYQDTRSEHGSDGRAPRAADVERLDRDGYVIISDVLDPDALAQMRSEVERLMAEKAFTAPGVAPSLQHLVGPR